MEDLDVDGVMGMGAGQIYGLANRHRVSLTGCNNVSQFRERLILHHKLSKGFYYDIEREFGTRHSESLDSIRRTLDELLDSVQQAMSGLTETLDNALRMDSEGANSKVPLVQQIQRRRHNLMTSQCSVIVAGETNAGKSTFLNLLLGMDVLPTSIFSCTAAICVLQHSSTFSAHILYHGGRRQSEEFQNAEDTKAWLTSIVDERNQEKRQQGLDIHAIHIHLPALVLQSGVTLVDTPGIGENEAMTSCTMNYVKQHSAAAYLYLIKTDNAGGVHDDRLLDFLRAILQYNEQDRTSELFDPSTAMFVCNRWDQVPDEQREGVRDNALQKLKDVWPKFEPSQAFFMSSMNAQTHYSSDPRYITEDYEKVLRGLKDMFGQARHNAVNQHYRWLKQLLHQSTSFLQTAMYNCSLSDEELMTRFRSTKQRLDALQKRTTASTEQLRLLVRAEIEQLNHSMKAILRDDSIRADLLDWSLQPIPSPVTFTPAELQNLQSEIDAMIMRRIMESVDREVRRQGLDRQLHNKLKTTFQEELKLVDEEINSIMCEMNDTNSLASSVSSHSSCASTDMEDMEQAMEMLRIYKERDGFRLGHLKSVSRVTESARAPASSEATIASVPKVLVGKMVSRILGPLASLAHTVQRARRNSQMTSKPLQYMRDRTDKMVGVVSNSNGCLAQMAAKYHEKMDAFILEVDNSIPRFIANNKKQMEDIKVNRRTYLSRRKELLGVMESLEPVREMLRGFGSLYIRDLTADNIFFSLEADQRRQSVAVNVMEKDRKEKVPKDSGLGESKRNEFRRSSRGAGLVGSVGGSLWSNYNKGHVAIGTQKKDVMGRTYIQGLSEHILIKEIARLRCLRCEDLAPFLGMSRLQDSPVFLFMGDLKSARRFLAKGFHKPSESVPRLLEGVLRGISYLHREGLVHMELSLDTIMVDENGDPRLCGACLPRRPRFPPDASLILADPFVCLSPEVLRDELYTADDDYYSFGLIVWETCLHDKPYRDFRTTLSLEEFRTQVHPSSMLGLETCENVGNTLSAILRGCLLPARGLRIKVEELREHVAALRSDPVVMRLSSTHRRDRAQLRHLKRDSSDDSTTGTWCDNIENRTDT